MELLSIIGFVAVVLTPLISLPQIIKSYRTKSTHDLSWGYIALLGFVALLWISYGNLTGDLPLMAANSGVLALALIQAVLKYKYDNAKGKRRG